MTDFIDRQPVIARLGRLRNAVMFLFMVLNIVVNGCSRAIAQAEDFEPLAIVTSSGARHEFQVEVARNATDWMKGLMHRQDLPSHQGMLFALRKSSPITMWMKNTYIALDMLFIRGDGVILRIAEDTTPLSLDAIPSEKPVLGVLEIRAGTTRRLGISAGDRVYHSIFDTPKNE